MPSFEKTKSGYIWNVFYFEYIRAFDGLIVEYLRLSYEFPEKNEEETPYAILVLL